MIRGTGISMIFQEPLNSLNPAFRIYDQVAEAVRIRRSRESGGHVADPRTPPPFDYTRGPKPAAGDAILRPIIPAGAAEAVHRRRIGRSEELYADVLEYLRLVRINDPETILDLYPHELSGGMRQRVMIAMALSEKPALLIADEPTSALDVTIQAQVLTLMKELIEEVSTSILFISHDLGVIAETADELGVMYAGKLVEFGPVGEVFQSPRHPYTKALLRAAPTRYKSRRSAHLDRGERSRTSPGLRRGAGSTRGARSPSRSAEPSRRPRFSRMSGPLRAPQRLPFRGRGGDDPVTDASRWSRRSDLEKHFPLARTARETLVGAPRRVIHAVDEVSFTILPGETVGLIGESGSGKTTLGWLVARLHDATGGTLLFAGEDILALRGAELRRWRRNAQIVFQDPVGSLDPRLKVWQIVGEPIRAQGEHDKRAVRARVGELLPTVGLPPDCLDQYPHEFSGGGRQRLSLARALSVDPRLIVLDEPTSALDVAVQAQILNRLVELQRERHVAYLLITHNVAAVRYVADRVAVMYLGRIVELGTVRAVLEHSAPPVHEGAPRGGPGRGRASAARPVPDRRRRPVPHRPAARDAASRPAARSSIDKCRTEYPPLRGDPGRSRPAGRVPPRRGGPPRRPAELLIVGDAPQSGRLAAPAAIRPELAPTGC